MSCALDHNLCGYFFGRLALELSTMYLHKVLHSLEMYKPHIQTQCSAMLRMLNHPDMLAKVVGLRERPEDRNI